MRLATTAVIAFAAAAALAGCGNAGSEDAAAEAAVAPLRALTHASLDGRPTAIAADGDNAWLITRDPARLVRASRTAGDRIKLRAWPVPPGAADVAVVSGSVWVANPRAGTVTQYRQGIRRSAMAIPGAQQIARSGNHMWVLGRGGVLTYVNADVSRVVGPPVALPRDLSRPTAIAAEGSDVWVADGSGNLGRVSANTFRVERTVIADISEFTSVTLAGGKLWAAGGPLGQSFGFLPTTGNSTYQTQPLRLAAQHLATGPHGGLVVAGGPLGEIAQYDLEGIEGPPLRIGDVGPVAVDETGVIWVAQMASRRIAAIGEGQSRSASAPIRIQEGTGLVGQVRLGDRPKRVINLLGEPAAYSSLERALPLDAPAHIGFVYAPVETLEGYYDKVSGQPALRYDNEFYFICAQTRSCAGRVGAGVVTNPRAVTSRGVSIGDRLQKARRRYKASCETASSEEGTAPAHCAANVGAHHEIVFIGDPISVIVLRSVRPANR